MSKILIIDDEELVRTAASRMLGVLGHEVIVAEDGPKGVALYEADIDVILLDLSMEEMAGAECFEQLKKRDPAAQIIICTGLGVSDETDLLLARGARGVLAKPFDLKSLSRAINEVV